MTPLTLHILILCVLSIPILVTGLFYLHYRFILKEPLKTSIANLHKSKISVIRVQKKGNVYEDKGEVPVKEAPLILFLIAIVSLSITWFTHAGITSLYFYVVYPSIQEVLLAHLISLFSLVVLHIINKYKS